MQTSSPLPLRDALQDADLCRAWRQLLAASPAYQALLDPDWWRSASDHLGHASHWYLACRHDGKDLRWLVLVQPRQALGMRWWQTAHHNHLPVAAMLRHPRVDPLQASNEVAQTLREDGALFLRCVRVPPGPVSESLQRSVSPPPAYTFPTGDFDTLFAGRSRNLRKQIRRREKRLAEQALVRFEVIDDPNHPTLGLDAFYQLEASGWKQDSASAIAFHEPLRNFYRQAAEDFAARGQFRLFALLADDAPSPWSTPCCAATVACTPLSAPTMNGGQRSARGNCCFARSGAGAVRTACANTTRSQAPAGWSPGTRSSCQ